MQYKWLSHKVVFTTCETALKKGRVRVTFLPELPPWTLRKKE